jgi:hydrogenase expression/formation protein HypE
MNKKYQNKKITMAHGSGGKASSDLIKDIFVDTFNNDYLATMEDQARFEMPKGRLALTTDSFVVSPLFFKGGDIGKLAVTGTVNDLAVLIFFIHCSWVFILIKSIFFPYK